MVRWIKNGGFGLLLLGGCFVSTAGSTPSVEDADVRDASPDRAVVAIPDSCVPSTETCNDTDDDCDGVVDEGVSRPCANACGTAGVEACVAGAFSACDAPAPPEESCDGADNDCDSRTDEGVVRACANACGEAGTEVCSGGSFLSCDAPAVPAELCDGVDNDCDPSTPDGSGEPTLAAACDGDDDDACEDGVFQCSGGSLGCDDDPASAVEVCDGVDNDCDLQIDEGDTCAPCIRHNRGTRIYLFCPTPVGWTLAEATCQMLGYELVTIEDGAENEWVMSTALATADEDWYIGINDRGVEGVWAWSSGSMTTYDHWASGEPNNYMAHNFDCGVIEDGEGAFEDREFWADRRCSDTIRFICELH